MRFSQYVARIHSLKYSRVGFSVYIKTHVVKIRSNLYVTLYSSVFQFAYQQHVLILNAELSSLESGVCNYSISIMVVDLSITNCNSKVVLIL